MPNHFNSDSCINTAWENVNNETCMPKAEFFNLRCGEDGIQVELDEILLPAAKEVFLLGGCKGQFDPARKGFYF